MAARSALMAVHSAYVQTSPSELAAETDVLNPWNVNGNLQKAMKTKENHYKSIEKVDTSVKSRAQVRDCL